MFTATLLTIAKTWKQLKCPLADDWIGKKWYIYTMDYYSVIKKNKIMPFAATQLELKTLLLSEVSQKENKYHKISLVSGIGYMAPMNLSTEKKLMDLQNRLVVARGEGEGVGWMGCLGLIDADSCLWNG